MKNLKHLFLFPFLLPSVLLVTSLALVTCVIFFATGRSESIIELDKEWEGILSEMRIGAWIFAGVFWSLTIYTLL